MGSCSKTEREAKAEDNDFKAKVEKAAADAKDKLNNFVK